MCRLSGGEPQLQQRGLRAGLGRGWGLGGGWGGWEEAGGAARTYAHVVPDLVHDGEIHPRIRAEVDRDAWMKARNTCLIGNRRGEIGWGRLVGSGVVGRVHI